MGAPGPVAAPGFQTWGGNCGAKVLTGGGNAKTQRDSRKRTFQSNLHTFHKCSFCMFNNNMLIFFVQNCFFLNKYIRYKGAGSVLGQWGRITRKGH